MMYLGDFNPGDTVRLMWSSNNAAGASITRATNGTISVYQNLNTTQTTTGVTDTEDFDGLTGIHAVSIDTGADGTFYAAGRDFVVVLSGATIDGQTVNAVLAHFSIQNRNHLRPTTAGRTLDVSAGGEAGVDWANIGSPTTAQNLSGTNIDTDQVVASVTGAVGSIGAGGIAASSFAAGAIDNAAIAADAIGASEIADGAIDAGAFAQGAADKVWGSTTRTLSAFGFSVTVGTNNDKTGYALSAAGIQAIWDALTAALTTASSIGKLLVDNINATISSRATPGDIPSAATIATTVWASADRQLTAISAALRNSIADNVLRRSLATALSSADGDTKIFRSLAGAVSRLVNRSRAAGGTLTVYETDDTTALGTQTLTTDAAAVPIVEANTD